MRNTAKRLVAMLLLCVMLFSCVQTPLTFAADVDTETTITSETPTASPSEYAEEGGDGESQPSTVTPTESEEPSEPATESTEKEEDPTNSTEKETEAKEEPTESTEESSEPTEQVTDPTEETEHKKVNTVTGHLDGKDAEVKIQLPVGKEVDAGSVLRVTNSEPNGETMMSIMTDYGIQAILDYAVFNMGIEGVNIEKGSTVKATLSFNNPSIMTLSTDTISVFEAKADGSVEKLQITNASLSESKRLSFIGFNIDGLRDDSQYIIVTSDQPSVVGWSIYSEYTVRADYYGAGLSNDAIGSSDGGLEYHCWALNGDADVTDFAICLNNLRLFGSGDGTYGYAQTDTSGTGDSSHTKEWAGFSTGLREALILLISYGMDNESPYAKYDFEYGDTYAALQLVAWEWIRGVDDCKYTQYYSSSIQEIAAGLRSYCINNPDNIDPDDMDVYLVWPEATKTYNGTQKWGQPHLALEGVRTQYGDLSVQKNISGSGDVSGWRFELYTSSSNASSATGYVSSAYTDSNGIAYFYDLVAGSTYYLREAPASRQDRKTTTGWSLSTSVKNVTVVANTTTSAGSVTNYSPGKLSVTKKISPSSMATSTNLQNWRFELYTSEASANAGGTDYVAYAYTNSSGIAYFDNLAAGTYYVREAPASRQDSKTTTGWVLATDVLSGNATVGATSYTSMGSVTNSAPGSLSVTKNITNAGDFTADKSNWRFELYETSANAQSGSNYVAYAYTNSSGIATFTGLTANKTYYVKEAPASRQDKHTTTGWALSTTVLSGTIAAGNTTSVGAVTNSAPVSINIRKYISTAGSVTGKLDGWVFQVATDSGFSNVVATITTIDHSNDLYDGTGTTGFVLKADTTYYVREAPMELQTRADKNDYVLDTNVVTLSASKMTAGSSVDAFYYTTGDMSGAISNNKEKGFIRVRKGVVGAEANESTLKDWVFYIYSDEALSNKVGSVVTGSDGYGTTTERFAPGDYWVQEAAKEYQIRSDIDKWAIDDSIVQVTVEPGAVNDAFSDYTAKNGYGKYVKLLKSASDSNCYEQIKANGMYTLAGAQYKITVNGETEIITTDANGSAISGKIYNVGMTGTIQEVKAPNGYLLDSTVYNFTIANDNSGYCVVNVKDDPTFDPAFGFKKVDPDTYNPQGDTSFQGAVFKMEYYDNTTWSGTPVRTWYFETDENGDYYYAEGWLADGYSSDELYTDIYGLENLPLGSIKISEVTAPDGYSSMTVLYATITQASNGGSADFNWTEESHKTVNEALSGNYEANENPNPDSFGEFELRKNDSVGITDVQGDVPNLTAKFQVINRSTNSVKIGDNDEAEPGKVCFEFETDTTGYFSSGKILPLGTYEIKEVTPPTGMNINSTWSQTFSVTVSESSFSYVTEEGACANEVIRGGVKVQKIDDDDKTGIAQGEATLDGAVLQVINNSTNAVYTDRDGNGTYAWYEPGEVCLYITTDDNGIAQSADDALPYGSYRVSENTEPTGYLLNEDWYQDFTIRTEGEIKEFTNTDVALPEKVIRGGVKVYKFDALLGTATGENSNLDGITYSVYSNNDSYVYVNNVKYNKGDVVATMELKWNASEGKWIAQLDGSTLPYGTYTVKENPMEDGSSYANEYFALINEQGIVEEYTFSIRNNGEIVEVDNSGKSMKFHNLPIGRIELLKVDVRNKKLEGVKFSLEWSENGTDWTPVTSVSYGTYVKGGSSTSGIVDGCLVTDSDGVIAYEGLDSRLQYRLVEVETLDGYMLLRDPVYTGTLGRNSSSEVELTARVVNSDIITLPESGSMDMVWMSMAIAICVTMFVVALVYTKKREEV